MSSLPPWPTLMSAICQPDTQLSFLVGIGFSSLGPTMLESTRVAIYVHIYTLYLCVQLRSRHDPPAEVLQVGEAGEVGRLLEVLRKLNGWNNKHFVDSILGPAPYCLAGILVP